MSDILEIMFMEQSELQEKLDSRVSVANKFLLGENTQIEVFNQTLHDHAESLIHEGIELMNWIKWKKWSQHIGNGWDRKDGNEQFSEQHIKEMKMETIDCFCFLLNICLILDMKPQEILDLYLEKLKINIERSESNY